MPKALPITLSQDGQAQLQQLQRGTDLDIPLADRVEKLEEKIKMLCEFLVAQGIELPDELTIEI